MGFIATNLDLSVLATLLKDSKRLAHLDVGEHMSDQKADIVVPLVDGIRPSREFSQDPLVDKSQLSPSTSSGHTPCSSKSKSCFSPHLLKKDTKQGAPGTVDLFTSTTQPSPPCYTIHFQRLSWLQALQVRLHGSICTCSQKWPRRQGPTPGGYGGAGYRQLWSSSGRAPWS